MIRNLKVLGLAMAAVFAMSAIVATVASAQGKLTSDGPVTLTATETESPLETNALTALGFTIECPDTSYTGHTYTTEGQTGNPKTHPFIQVPATTVTLTPHYKQANHNCKIVGTAFKVTVDVNGCDYVLHLGATQPGIDTYAVTADVVCPPGKEITITAFTNEHDHTVTNKPFCVIHIPSQNGLAGAHAKDTTNGHIDITGTFNGIVATRTASATHPALCPHTTVNTGKFDIDVTVSGHNAAGGATNISLSH